MDNFEPASRLHDENLSTDQDDFVTADVKPRVTGSTDATSSVPESTGNQRLADSSSKGLDMASLLAMKFSKSSTNDKDNIENPEPLATSLSSPACGEKISPPPSSVCTSNSTPHHQKVRIASDAEQKSTNVNVGAWIKSEPASTVSDLSNATVDNAGENIPDSTSVEKTAAGASQCQPKFSHEDAATDMDDRNQNRIPDNCDKARQEDSSILISNDRSIHPLDSQPENSRRESERIRAPKQVSQNDKDKDKDKPKVKRLRKDPARVDCKRMAGFACWICFEKFDRSLDVKKHLLDKHKKSKVLCAYAHTDIKCLSTSPQLLMYCPNDCEYVTGKLYVFPHHVAMCNKPALHTTGMEYLNSSGTLVSGNIVDKGIGCNTKSASSGRSKATTSQAKKPRKQKGTSGKTSEQRVNTIRAEDWHDNFTCQRCKLIFSSSLFLKQHEIICCSGNLPEFAPSHQGLARPQSSSEMNSELTRSTTIEEKAYKCDLCTIAFQDNGDYEKHMATTHSKTKRKNGHTCKVCKQVFNYVKTFRAHMRTHTEKAFKCTMCDRVFSNSTRLDAHIRIHRGEKPFECDTCGKSYERTKSLYEHMLTHTEERPFKCQECGRGFQKKCILASHMRTHTGEKPYQCSTCGKSFAQSGTLSVHLKTHVEDKPYVCSECGMRFKQKRTHIIHMRKHKGEELFQCEQCGKCCYHSANLRRHMMTHTDERPYVCNECGKRFTQTNGLKSHMRIHTGEKPYQCKVCFKRFVRSTHLTVHRRSHTGEKPYHCQLCDKRFMHNISLRIHTKSHHDGQYKQAEQKQSYNGVFT